MTLHRHWPEVDKDAGDDQSVRARRSNAGTLISTFRRTCCQEWRKIEPYKAKGFIADWP